MMKLSSPSRRNALVRVTIYCATLLLPSALRAQILPLKLTPSELEGPFYPRVFPSDTDNDLTQIKGAPLAAIGQRLTLSGRLLWPNGLPVVAARVEIWQTDHDGNYIHPEGTGRYGPRDLSFQGFGATLTDANGRYQFLTIKPRPYETRPAHVHFKIKRAGKPDFVTQMYFQGENQEGGLFKGFFDGWSPDRPALTASVKAAPSTQTLRAEFDIVVAP